VSNQPGRVDHPPVYDGDSSFCNWCGRPFAGHVCVKLSGGKGGTMGLFSILSGPNPAPLFQYSVPLDKDRALHSS